MTTCSLLNIFANSVKELGYIYHIVQPDHNVVIDLNFICSQ